MRVSETNMFQEHKAISGSSRTSLLIPNNVYPLNQSFQPFLNNVHMEKCCQSITWDAINSKIITRTPILGISSVFFLPLIN